MKEHYMLLHWGDKSITVITCPGFRVHSRSFSSGPISVYSLSNQYSVVLSGLKFGVLSGGNRNHRCKNKKAIQSNSMTTFLPWHYTYSTSHWYVWTCIIFLQLNVGDKLNSHYSVGVLLVNTWPLDPYVGSLQHIF